MERIETKGDEGESSSQSVNTIYEIDCIDYQQQDERCQQPRYRKGERIDAEESVEAVDAESAERKTDGYKDLDGKFDVRAYGKKVVYHAYEIEQRAAYAQSDKAGVEGSGQWFEGEMHDDGCNGTSDKGGGHKDYSAETRDSALMDFAR